MSTFTGFSEEDLKRIKSSESGTNSGHQAHLSNVRKIDRIGSRVKKLPPQYKLAMLQKPTSDDTIDSAFDKCKLSLKSTTLADTYNGKEIECNDKEAECNDKEVECNDRGVEYSNKENISVNVLLDASEVITRDRIDTTTETVEVSSRKNSTNVTPDVVRCVDNYTEDDLASHRVKLEELQLKQKIMEEQNKKRKEMLAKALADRTKQTEEEVQRLEKIKKELQVLDGQFSLDVAVLRKKIDQACLGYSDAEKHYLKVEKEFLQAKINLQKEKEKKELLTEHLCALITHNETRKAQKLETLMLELATDKKNSVKDVLKSVDDTPVIIDGVDERTGKIVEIPPDS